MNNLQVKEMLKNDRIAVFGKIFINGKYEHVVREFLPQDFPDYTNKLNRGKLQVVYMQNDKMVVQSMDDFFRKSERFLNDYIISDLTPDETKSVLIDDSDDLTLIENVPGL
jgi:hypothetical protein